MSTLTISPIKYMDQFKEAQKEASDARRGLWGDVCACREGEETGRTCIACYKARVIRMHWDCSTYTVEVADNGCTSGCYTPPAPAPSPAPQQCKYSCVSPDRNCSDFATHAEAVAFWNCCGFTATNDPMRLDGRGNAVDDGDPCESLP